MRKTALFLLLITVFVSAGYFALRTNAQTFDAAKAYQDYQYELSVYGQDYSDFKSASTFYKSNSTLQLEDSTRQKTLKLLQDRDQLMITYLTALRMQIVETTGFTADQKGAIFSKIDPEVAWYKTHIQNYLASDALIDLFNKSDESKSRYKTNTLPIIDESLIDIGLSKEIGLRLDHQQVYADLKTYINQQVAIGKMTLDPFNMWLNETDAVLQNLQGNEGTTSGQIQKIYSQSYSVNGAYSNTTQTLLSSQTMLIQLNNYLTEMLATIQNLNNQ